MDVRDYLQANPAVAVAAVLCAVAGSAYFAYSQMAPSRPRGGESATRAFASIDDGKTYFETTADNLAPFQHQGQTAYEAVVFNCSHGKPPFVGYLRRYSDAVKASIRDSRAKAASTGRPGALDWTFSDGVEIKRPGDKTWIKANDITRSRTVLAVRCPDAPDQPATPLIP